MFNLFRSRPPIETREKAWIESRLKWIIDEFGADTILNVPIVRPSELPATDGRDETDVRRLMEWIADRMHIDPAPIVLEIVDANDLPGANGTWQPTDSGSLICITGSVCGNVAKLAKVLTHELAHERLLGEDRIDPEIEDHEPLADLLTTAFGLGICVANATIIEQFSRDGRWYSWQISRSGYLTAAELGYAHAVLAWLRDERRPTWAKDLRLDARAAFHRGLRYLRRTGDSLLTPDNVRQKSSSQSTDSLLDDLRQGTPTRRLAALWELEQRPEVGHDVLTEIRRRIDDCDQDVQCAAIAAFGRLAEPAEAADELFHRLGDPELPVQLSAAAALDSVDSIPDDRCAEIEMILRKSREPLIWDAAANLLSRFGTSAESSAPLLIDPLIHALNACRDRSIIALIAAIDALTDDPKRFLKSQLAMRDEELCRQAVSALGEFRAVSELAGAVQDGQPVDDLATSGGPWNPKGVAPNV